MSEDGKMKSRTEYNRNEQKVTEWIFDHSHKHKLIATYRIFHDSTNDETVDLRTFTYLIVFNKDRTVETLSDGRHTLYFKYY